MRQSGSATTITPFLTALIAALALLCMSALPVAQTGRPAPTLLILGAAQYNGRPSPAFRARLDHALELYRSGGVTRIVVSGGIGRGDQYSEGQVGVAYLRARGVPEGVLIAETSARSTLQNIVRSRDVLNGPVTLVTDQVHARRALALAKAEHLSADVSATAAYSGDAQYRQRELLLLSAYVLLGPTDHTQEGRAILEQPERLPENGDGRSGV